ncbi:MAG: acyl-CoA dehydrogenase family protein [Anaerolineae bacterium]
MDFALSPELQALQQRTRKFIDGVVIPAEREIPHEVEPWDALRTDLQRAARDAGLFLPQLSREWGGLGLNWRECAVVFEEAGRSLLGPQALNCSAPDEGNMHLLERIATQAQKEKYLKPLAAGEIRSCFSMTEPAPGAGADPALLKATAERRGDKWILNGRKWFITGALGAAFTIAIARTGELHKREGATMFLVDAANPGFRIVRKIPTLDSVFPGGHGEVEFVNCEVGDEAVLGEVGQGFEYAQMRLGPGRLTHCMRWIGAARRAMEFAVKYAARRDSFGAKLAEHQGVQFPIADSEIELHAARLMVWHAAWLLDQGDPAPHETSMTKVFVAETVNRVIDRALQICGGLGVSEDIPLALLYREARPFRIYDGPSEVHRLSIARRVFRRAQKN